MLTPKYFARIRQLAAAPVDTDAFDFSDLGKGGGLAGALVRNRVVHWLLRNVWPRGRIGRFAWVVRHADVAQVRSNTVDFIAPYGEEMMQLTGGANFLLGMEDGPDYRRQLAYMRAAIRPSDIADLIAPNAAALSESLTAHSGGEIDAVQDVLVRVAAETCADYFGLEIDNAVDFSRWLMSLSALLFADYFGDEKVHRLAVAGSARLTTVIDRAIAKAHAIREGGTRDGNIGPEELASRDQWMRNTVVGRLVDLQVKGDGPTDKEIRAIVMGTAVGYVPTGGGAGGNILDVLLKRTTWLKRAHEAALGDDDDALGRILYEAMRFSPPINPGLPRFVKQDAKIGPTQFKAGDTVLAAAMSAMFDGRVIRKPEMFDPDRDLSRDLQFGGDYLHWCFGEEIARALLLHTFKPLLRRKNLRRAAGKAGRKATTGPFPQHLCVVFDPETGHRNQTLVTICVPVTQPVQAADIDRELDRLGNPAVEPLKAALDASERIHFAHVVVVDGDRGEKNQSRSDAVVIVEFTADGETDSAIDCFVDAASVHLMPTFTLATGVTTASALKTLLKSHVRRLVPGRVLPWRSTASGVNFVGTPELSVVQIERDRRLYDAAREKLQQHLASRKGRGGLAMPALASVRAQLRMTGFRSQLARPDGQDLAVARRDDRNLYQTLASLASDRTVIAGALGVLFASLAVHFLLDARIYTGFRSVEDIATFAAISLRVLASFAVGGGLGVAVIALFHAAGRRAAAAPSTVRETISQSGLTLAALTVLLGLAGLVMGQRQLGVPVWDTTNDVGRLILVGQIGLEILSSLVIGLAIVMLMAAAALTALLLMLRRSETNGQPEDFDPPFGQVQDLLKRENADGHVQNHIVAVTRLKTNPRWLRRFTLGLAFWGIAKLVEHRFRPGFVLDIGTIHFARWLRLPGTDKLIFFSNYDGSWESYLEDFITKAHLGQTAVWSNGVGFPESRFLIFGGAQDGARFKRWVRRQQVPSRFWYSRFRDLTTDQMRKHALVAQGLAKACTESEAQAWLDLFGSQPRPPGAMEYDEVQTIVFSGMGRLRASELVPMRIPEDNTAWPEWLLGVIDAESQDGSRKPAHHVTFGELPPENRAMALAFSAAGLRRLGLADLPVCQTGQSGGTTLGTFPNAFLDGMASPERARILGDFGASASEHWPWTQSDGEPHALLLIYAADGQTLATFAAAVKSDLAERGFVLLPSIHMQELHGDLREPFGFADGVSQPIIRGSRPVRHAGDAINVVEPGEFVLGYPDNRGDIPPSPVVAAQHAKGILPDPAASTPGRFPDFEGRRAVAPRDFGRNGSFLVVRQLEQDVDGFHAQAEAKAAELRAANGGAHINRDWVEARLVGRWQNGTSVLRYPLAPSAGVEPDNDFLYGRDDPQGLKCPYGAHIRRAFPRDSLSPDNPHQLTISNRHRLMRRGRTYLAEGAASNAPAKGVLFMCLNADIERQFEFVQQTWISSPNFHGLAGEPDPIAVSRAAEEGPGRAGFTIPTSLGPTTLKGMQSFVTVKNGGYFFVPGWTALRFLATLPPTKVGSDARAAAAGP